MACLDACRQRRTGFEAASRHVCARVMLESSRQACERSVQNRQLLKMDGVEIQQAEAWLWDA